MRYGLLLAVFFLSLANAIWSADPVAEVEKEKKSSIRFSGMPAVAFGPDTGFRAGVIGSMYVDKEGYSPYMMALGVKAIMSTKGGHSHALQLDQISAFGLPLRLTTRLGFYSTIAQNYCGRASDSTCDESDAENAAIRAGLSGGKKDLFVKRYYLNRYMSVFGNIFARWLLWQSNATKLELMTNYRGIYYMDGNFKFRHPYVGSLYAEDYKDEKTEGYLSTAEVGLMLDSRDNEAAPTSGYWIETSIRGGSWLFGSAWDYLGANAAARFYVPLDEGRRVVIASQTIFDAAFGDLPFDAMSRIGGTLALNDFNAVGGEYIGRGIREQRFVGKLKAIQQGEFRYRFWSFDLFRQNFDLVAAAFGDFAMTAWDVSRFTKDMKNIYVGFGGGLRLHWNKTFVVRADLGVSPSEKFSPMFYLVVNNVF